MSKICLLQNELFQGFSKLVATDNIESVLDVPEVPVPYTCVTAMDTEQPEKVMEKLDFLFSEFKVKGKNFLKTDDDTLPKMLAIFDIVNLCGGASVVLSQPPKVTPIEQPVVENIVVNEAPATNTVEQQSPTNTADDLEETPLVVEAALTENKVDNPVSQEQEVVKNDTPNEATEEQEIIEIFGIPKGVELSFSKNESVKAILVDEKNVIFQDEEVSIIDAAKKAFKKTGAAGLASGLSNWMYNGKSLKVLKDERQ